MSELTIEDTWFMAGMRGTGSNTLVAAEIARYGTAMSGPEGKLVQVIGDPDDPEVQAQSIVFRYGLATSFPEPVHQEIARGSFAISESEIVARTDLRNLPIVTIDGELARDFDDAVYGVLFASRAIDAQRSSPGQADAYTAKTGKKNAGLSPGVPRSKAPPFTE